VSADGNGAVGIQLLGGQATHTASIHPMSVVMDYFHRMYDASLRFLPEAELKNAMA
jgi:hypothetical protein